MSKPDKAYRKREINGRPMRPESLAMGYGYDPHMSEGSIKPPIFQTSTFAFRTAAEGEAIFRAMAGKRQKGDPEDTGLAYSRMNNPSLEVLEDRLTLYDSSEESLVFSSGMAAITTALMAFAKAGSSILYTNPLYGGTEVFIRNMLPDLGVTPVEVDATAGEVDVLERAREAAKKGPLKVIFTETPGNPTNTLVDLEMFARVRDTIAEETGHCPILMCDNTMMGPVGQAPLEFGVDLVLYSLTKYIGGHSDLIAGAVLGSSEHLAQVRRMRTYIGGVPDPHTCWMLMRSIETVSVRMERAFANAKVCANFLKDHPKVENVRFLDFLGANDPQRAIYDRQCKAAGSTFSFDVKGGKEPAFRVLDNLQLIKLAVSLGGTESLICHPGSTTHSGVPVEARERIGFTDSLLRISIGIENEDDLVADLDQALTHA